VRPALRKISVRGALQCRVINTRPISPMKKASELQRPAAVCAFKDSWNPVLLLGKKEETPPVTLLLFCEQHFSRACVDGHRGNVPPHTEKIRPEGHKIADIFQSK
jgi:hypothetical protein